MPRKEKINQLKSLLKIEDNKTAENYLIKANWNIEKAKKLYELENPNNSESNNILDNTQIEFNINEIIKESNEVFSPKNKSLYDDFIKSLEKLFPNQIVLSYKNFFSSTKEAGGLIIIFPESKINELRNNLIRVVNKKNSGIKKNISIFPILKESEAGNKIIKALGVKSFPFYMFCKYKNEETLYISYNAEKKLLMKDLKDIMKKLHQENIVELSISLDGEKSILNYNDFSGDIKEQESIYQYVRLLNDNINTLYDASRDDTISNLSNISNTSESEDSQKSNNNIFNKENITKKTNSHNNSISSTLDTNIQNNSIETNQLTQNTTRVTVNNFIGKKNYDINICTIKFINSNDKTDYKIKEFIKTDKVSSLFDYVESLKRDMKSIGNFINFDLAHGFPPTYISRFKNKTLLEEDLFPLSEVYICKK